MSEDLLGLTAQIVSAHVKKNAVEVGDLPTLIRDVYKTLSGLGDAAPAPVAEAAKPAVPANEVGLRFAHHLHGVREEDDNVETPSDDRAWPDHRSIPVEIQPAGNLPDGGSGLCQDALVPRQGNGPG